MLLKSTESASEWVDDITAGSITMQNEFMFESTPTAPPTGSEIRFNNANQALATLVWVKNTSVDGADVTAALGLTQAGSVIYIQDKDDATKYQRYKATGAAVNKGTYTEIPVSWQNGGAALPEQRVIMRISSPGGGSTDLSVYQQKSEKDQPSGYVGLSASSRIVLGGDANLYRRAANALQTDGDFYVANSIIALGNTIYFGTALDTYLNRYAAGGLRASGIFQVTSELYVDTGGTGSKIFWGSAADVNLYRRSAGVLQTNGSFYINSASAYLGILQPGDAALRWNARYDGMMQWGPGNAASDTNLYRSAAGMLKTDGLFRIGTDLVVRDGAAQQLVLGLVGTSVAGIAFGSAADTNLYRSAAGQLKTDGVLFTGSQVWAMYGTANQVILGSNGAGVSPGICFGSALDTNLYRQATNQLRTGGQFDVGGALFLYNNSPTVPILFGAAADTNLYRAAAGLLRTDNRFLPANFDVGPNIPGDDFNNAVYNGWFYGDGSSLNAPLAGFYWAVEVVNITYTGACRQIAYQHGTIDAYQRFQNGAGVWSAWVKVFPVGDAALPLRLNSITSSNGISDPNTAVANGWYFLGAGGTNLPPRPGGATDWNIQVIAFSATQLIQQIAYWLYGNEVWMRSGNPGAWTAWVKTYPVSLASVSGRIRGSDGVVLSGAGFSASRTAVGTYVVTYTAAYAVVPVVLANCEASGYTCQLGNGTNATGSVTIAVRDGAGNPADFNVNFAVFPQ